MPLLINRSFFASLKKLNHSPLLPQAAFTKSAADPTQICSTETSASFSSKATRAATVLLLPHPPTAPTRTSWPISCYSIFQTHQIQDRSPPSPDFLRQAVPVPSSTLPTTATTPFCPLFSTADPQSLTLKPNSLAYTHALLSHQKLLPDLTVLLPCGPDLRSEPICIPVQKEGKKENLAKAFVLSVYYIQTHISVDSSCTILHFSPSQ